MKKICTPAGILAMLLFAVFRADAQNPSHCATPAGASCNIINPEGMFDVQGGFQSTGGLSYSASNKDFRDMNTHGVTNLVSTITSPVYPQVNNYGKTVSAAMRVEFGSRIQISYVRLDIINAESGQVIASCTQTGFLQSFSSGNRICFNVQDMDIQPQLNIRYRFVTNYSRTTAGAVNEAYLVFDDFGTGEQAASMAPLPVVFTAISVSAEQGKNLVSWKVAGENEVLHYEVEHSRDNISWEKAGTVNARAAEAYLFTDASGYPASFYRVKAVDGDGSHRYSAVAAVKNSRQGFTVRIQNGQMLLEHARAGENALIAIYAMDGRMLQQLQATAGSLHTILPVNSLAPGAYFVRFIQGQEVQSAKFIR